MPSVESWPVRRRICQPKAKIGENFFVHRSDNPSHFVSLRFQGIIWLLHEMNWIELNGTKKRKGREKECLEREKKRVERERRREKEKDKCVCFFRRKKKPPVIFCFLVAFLWNNPCGFTTVLGAHCLIDAIAYQTCWWAHGLIDS